MTYILLQTPTWVLLLFRGVVATIWLRWCRCEARHPTHKHTQQSTRFNNHSLANFGCRFGFDPVCACKPSNHASNGWVPRPDSDVLVSFRPSKTHQIQHALSLFCIALYMRECRRRWFLRQPTRTSCAHLFVKCRFCCFSVSFFVFHCCRVVWKVCDENMCSVEFIFEAQIFFITYEKRKIICWWKMTGFIIFTLKCQLTKRTEFFLLREEIIFHVIKQLKMFLTVLWLWVKLALNP
jgi:hypothetical protein